MGRTGIVTFDFFPLIGGIGRHVHLMFSQLQDQDLAFFSPAQNSLPRHHRISHWSIRYLKQVGVSIWLHRNVQKIVSEFGLERLNVHCGPGGVLLVRKPNVPVIVTCHHTYKQQCRHLKSQFWKYLFVPFEKRTYRLATTVISVSDATKRALIEEYGIPQGKIVTVYNAVDLRNFHPLPVAKESRTILYVGRIDRRKGIDFLIESMPLVLQEVPDAQLMVGGKGNYLEKMKALARRLGIESRVTFLGFVPELDLNELYNKAQCVVVPSVFEGFGITVIEALAAGTRVVGTEVDGIREILADGSYGRVAPHGDHRLLAAAIVAELKNPERAGELSSKYRVEEFRSGYLRMVGGAAPEDDSDARGGA